MNWCILLFLVSCAAALPQERPHHVRRVVTHRRVPIAAASPQAASRIPQPVKVANSAKRVQAVRVFPAVRPTAVKATTLPLRSPIPPPVRTASGVKRVTAIKRVPAIKPFPGVKALSKEERDALQRQIQQWQIAVLGGAVPPPGPAGPPGPPGTAPPVYPAGPGTIWIQVPSGGYPSYPGGYPPYPGPPSLPPPPPPASAEPAPPPIPEEAYEGSAQPVPEAPPAEEGVAPQEEIPATGGEGAPAEGEGEIPAEGVAPEEIPTDEVAPEEEVHPVPEGEAPTEELPSGGETPPEGVAPEEEVPEPAPEGELPAEETPAEGGAPTGGEPAVPPGDEQEDKLVHCKEERGQFSHESSCSKFYNCWDDVVVEQSCPHGLAFSEEHSYCDFPENVDCGETTLDSPSMPIEEHGGCASSYGSYRSKTNCSEFFICVNGQPVQFACPESLSYNEDLGVCDYPYRVDCVSAPAPETPPDEATGGDEAAPEAPSAPEEHPSEPAPPAEEPETIPDAVRGLPPSFLKAGSPCWHNNVYPLNNACSRVSVCRSGVTSILACPKGMAYDKYKRRCLPYYRVRC